MLRAMCPPEKQMGCLGSKLLTIWKIKLTVFDCSVRVLKKWHL